jgi:hypothetical protein
MEVNKAFGEIQDERALIVSRESAAIAQKSPNR